jgi:hypothetical protein
MTTPNDHGVEVKKWSKGWAVTWIDKEENPHVVGYWLLKVWQGKGRGHHAAIMYNGIRTGTASPKDLRAIGEAFIAAADEFAAEGGG